MFSNQMCCVCEHKQLPVYWRDCSDAASAVATGLRCFRQAVLSFVVVFNEAGCQCFILLSVSATGHRFRPHKTLNRNIESVFTSTLND